MWDNPRLLNLSANLLFLAAMLIDEPAAVLLSSR